VPEVTRQGESAEAHADRPRLSKAWKLAFVRSRDVWTANGDGTGQRRVLKDAEAPCWSPDRSQMAFARRGNVWVANADGSGERQLTSQWKTAAPTSGYVPSGAGRPISISWDPKSDLVTFSHWEEFRITKARQHDSHTLVGCSIYDIPLDPAEHEKGGLRFDIYDDDTSYGYSYHSHPAWSRSGTRLAFVRNGDIWLAARGEQIYPAELSRVHRTPEAWQWEVTRVAAVASFDAATYRVSRENYGVSHLSWARDEQHLAYALVRLGGSGTWDVHVMKLGSDERDRPVSVEDRYITEGLEPCWSPDGKSIAYSKAVSGDIWAISVDGMAKCRLIKDGVQPAW